MSNIALPFTFSANSLIKSADVNADLAEVQTKFNSFAVQTDVAATIGVTHTFTPAQTFNGGAKLGSNGTVVTQIVVYTPTITPASVAAATVAEQTFSVPGLTTADKVIVNPPAIANATGMSGFRVSAADTLAIRFVNPTAGALTPTAGTYTVLAVRS